MKKLITLSAMTLLCANTLLAEAPLYTPEDTQKTYNVGLKVGTLGAGIEVSTPLKEQYAVRFNINGASYSRTETEEQIEYDADLKFANAGILLDYFPFEQRGFRLTAGVYYNGNTVDGTAQPEAGTYTINGFTYEASDIASLDASLDFDRFAPYLGLGWGTQERTKGFNFSLDVGILFSKPSLTYSVTCGDTTDAAMCEQIKADVALEKASVDDDLDDINFYPVVMLGVAYNF